MSTSVPSQVSDPRARRNVAVLVMAQAILGSQITMIFTAGGLAGQALASNPCWATLPISMIVLGSMTTAPWLSAVMQKYGRRTGFVIGGLGGLVGSLLAVQALRMWNFPLFLVGSYFTGIYMSAQGFYRFAATDTASEAFRPKAISYVMAGGLISAVIGPQLFAQDAKGEIYGIPFLGTLPCSRNGIKHRRPGAVFSSFVGASPNAPLRKASGPGPSRSLSGN